MSQSFGTVRGAPPLLRWIAGALRPLLRKVLIDQTAFDVRLIRWRLSELGTRPADVSALIAPEADDRPVPAALIDLSLRVIQRANANSNFLPQGRAVPDWAWIWPGEHYRLLPALAAEIGPQQVIEIGTHTGLGTLALRTGLPAGGRITTFDIMPWTSFSATLLRHEDFADGCIRQVVADLGNRDVCRQHRELLASADLIFVDAAKDGTLEKRLWANFEGIGLKPGALIVFDDIRLWNMLDFWRSLDRPKLDLTSFGHFTGTGLVLWQ